jgi:hypothetical protein
VYTARDGDRESTTVTVRCSAYRTRITSGIRARRTYIANKYVFTLKSRAVRLADESLFREALSPVLSRLVPRAPERKHNQTKTNAGGKQLLVREKKNS